MGARTKWLVSGGLLVMAIAIACIFVSPSPTAPPKPERTLPTIGDLIDEPPPLTGEPFFCERGTAETPSFYLFSDVGTRCVVNRLSVNRGQVRDEGVKASFSSLCISRAAQHFYACAWEHIASRDLSEATDEEKAIVGDKRCDPSEKLAFFEYETPLLLLVSANSTCVWDTRSGTKIYEAPESSFMLSF